MNRKFSKINYRTGQRAKVASNLLLYWQQISRNFKEKVSTAIVVCINYPLVLVQLAVQLSRKVSNNWTIPLSKGSRSKDRSEAQSSRLINNHLTPLLLAAKMRTI